MVVKYAIRNRNPETGGSFTVKVEDTPEAAVAAVRALRAANAGATYEVVLKF